MLRSWKQTLAATGAQAFPGHGNPPALKKELVHDEDYATRGEARATLFAFIEVFYNRVRRHSSLGYKSPVEHERAG